MRPVIFHICIFVLAISTSASAGEVLIKPEEAALPPAISSTAKTRALTRKPEIVLILPASAVNSPFEFRLKFQAHGGSNIDTNSFRLIYLKNPNIDLTSRVKSHVTAQGLEMVDAEAPPGQHAIEALVSDSDNREGSAVFTLNISKQTP